MLDGLIDLYETSQNYHDNVDDNVPVLPTSQFIGTDWTAVEGTACWELSFTSVSNLNDGFSDCPVFLQCFDIVDSSQLTQLKVAGWAALVGTGDRWQITDTSLW